MKKNRNATYYQRNKEVIKEKNKLYLRKKRQDPKLRKIENDRQRKYLATMRATNPEWKEKNNKYFRELMRKRNNIPEEKWKIKQQ